MNILLTGGAGFIGHNVTRILEEQGHTCLVLDTYTGYGFVPPNELDYLIKHRKKRYNSITLNCDIRDSDAVNKAFDQFTPDVVIHLASFPRQKIVGQNPILGSDVMMTGLMTLLEASKTHNVQKFVYISSSMVYGDFEAPLVDETAKCNPIGQYGIMKYAGEKLVEDYSRKDAFVHTIIRPSAVYGEWDVRDRVASMFMTKAMNGETLTVNGANEVLDFTYVEDTAMGIALAATSKNANGNIYNITRSSQEVCTLGEAAKMAVDIAGGGSIVLKGRDLDFPKRGRLSIAKAQADFNYMPTVDVEEGFNRYYAWYTANPKLL